MPRQPAHIRDAAPGDADDLLALWSPVLREEGTVRATQDAVRALAQLAGSPDERLLVVEHEGSVVAAVHMIRRPVSPLAVELAVHTSYLVVAPTHRRHGYAHALLEAAVEWAEEKDVSQVIALTDGNRETNRFFARLGLSTMATVRSAPTAALRKRLSATRARAGGNRHLVEVLAQRRSARRRQSAG